MNSEELGLEIEKIIGDMEINRQDCILVTRNKIMSLISKNCWLKVGKGELDFTEEKEGYTRTARWLGRPVKPIKEIK